MKAGEFLKKVTSNPFIEFSSIYTNLDGRLVPITAIKPDRENNLVFFSQNKKQELSMRKIRSILLLHQNKTIYFWNGGNKIKIYGYRITGNKIII
ncbi:hypothetical protein ACWY2R_07720 [Enterococcus avium]